MLFGRYEEGHHVGKGVRWSADRRGAQIVEDGVPKGTIDMTDAIKMKKELGFNDDVLSWTYYNGACPVTINPSHGEKRS